MRREFMFADRAEAGRRLAERLAGMALVRPVVLALPRGGVPVGAEIARMLAAPLDVVFVRKIGAPNQPELALGAVADGAAPEIVLNEALVGELGLDEAYIAAAAARELAVIEQRRRAYAGVRVTVEVAGCSAIVVDDGVATGMTMQAALRQLRRRRNPARLIAAAPVIAEAAADLLRAAADAVVCLAVPHDFGAVGAYYRDFAQVSDREVARLLRDASARSDAPGSQ